jgi:2-succinyl-6-hydroxy-2,4-cyclohexadiene-1-carboxylate synthase
MAQLHAETHGDATRPAVALVHGMMSTNRQWRPNVDALAPHFHLVLIELWGHGSSPTPVEPRWYGVDGLIEAVDEVRVRHGIDRWALVGHSFGAAVALRYALERPASTRAVVFTNSRSAMSAATARNAAKAAEQITDEEDPRRIPFHPAHARRVLPELQDELALDADRTDRQALRRFTEAHWELSVRSRLEGITVPATLINGRFERLFQPDVDLIRSAYPNITVVDVDAGHSPNIEAADDFNRITVRSLGE